MSTCPVQRLGQYTLLVIEDIGEQYTSPTLGTGDTACMPCPIVFPPQLSKHQSSACGNSSAATRYYIDPEAQASGDAGGVG